jgi:hypothetical protein
MRGSARSCDRLLEYAQHDAVDRDWEAATADLPPLADPIRLAWDEFPRTATLKIRRNELRERLVGAEPVGKGNLTSARR